MQSNPQIDPAQLQRLHAQAYSWALTCTGGRPAEAQDVLQTVYLEILEGRARFDARAELRTWLFAVIRTTSRSIWRRARLRSRLLLDFAAHDPQLEVASSDPKPDEVAARDQSAAQVLAAWRKLPARQREILDLVFYRDLSIAQAAQIIGVSLGTARQHYERAKVALRRSLPS